MFYTKCLKDGQIIKTPVTTKNVFAICPGCGKEVSINWLQYFMYSPKQIKCIDIYCDNCKNKIKFMSHLKGGQPNE